MDTPITEFLTIAQLAQVLGTRWSSAQELVRKGRFGPALRLGAHVVVRADAVEQYLDGRAHAA